MEDGAQDVADIAGEPDNDEEDGEAIGGGAAEVFKDLGREDYDPAGDRDGSGNGRAYVSNQCRKSWAERCFSLKNSPADATERFQVNI